MGMTETQRETAAQLLAETMVSTEWRDLRPFTRAKYRTAILTIERIFARAQSVHPEAQCGIAEAATAIDALLKERDALQSLAKELSDALLACRPLGGSELFIKRFGQHYADPVYCKAAIEECHNDCHEAIKESVRNRRRAETAEQERDALQARVKELEQERNVQMLRALKAADRALRAEQERDEAYERAAKVAESPDIWKRYDGDFEGNCIASAIRRLAGPEKEGK